MSDFVCESCGQSIRKPKRWKPDPELHVKISEAAKELGISRQAAMNLIEDRWLEIAGRHYGRHARNIITDGVIYVTKASISNARQRKHTRLTKSDKWKILQTLSDIGVIGTIVPVRPSAAFASPRIVDNQVFARSRSQPSDPARVAQFIAAINARSAEQSRQR